MNPPNISLLLIDALRQIEAAPVAHERTGNELEDSTKAAFVDALYIPEEGVFTGAEGRKQTIGKGKRISDEDRGAYLDAFKGVIDFLNTGTCTSTAAKTAFIKHPLGKQNWPEFALYHHGKVLPIEVKSSKDGRITWNGGLPRLDCLYIYYYTHKKCTDRRCTFFFGEDIINAATIGRLKEGHRRIQEFAASVHAEMFPEPGSNMGFAEYVRAMFTHNEKIHGHAKRHLWKAKATLRVAEWGDAKATTLKPLRDDVKNETRWLAEEERKRTSERDGAATAKKRRKR